MGLIKIPRRSINYYKENVDEIFTSGGLSEGKWNEKITNFIKNLTSAKSALSTNSNGSGLVGLMSIYRHYYNRDYVMIQNNTMYGVKSMIIASGCSQLGFINCQIKTLMPSFNDVKYALSKINKNQKERLIILLSHIGGIINPDIEKISNLCKDENIILLEDCAHSFAATFNGKHSGLFGDAGVYSFYATKSIPVGEGGVVVTNNIEIGEMIKKFSIYDRFDQKLDLGNNIRISELQALFSYSIIKEWKEIILNKYIIAKKYIKICDLNNIKFINQRENGHFGNYYKFILINEKIPIKKSLPNLKTITSPVYDYDIGEKNPVVGYHECLPIWYDQELEITEKVINELK